MYEEDGREEKAEQRGLQLSRCHNGQSFTGDELDTCDTSQPAAMRRPPQEPLRQSDCPQSRSDSSFLCHEKGGPNEAGIGEEGAKAGDQVEELCNGHGEGALALAQPLDAEQVKYVPSSAQHFHSSQVSPRLETLQRRKRRVCTLTTDVHTSVDRGQAEWLRRAQESVVRDNTKGRDMMNPWCAEADEVMVSGEGQTHLQEGFADAPNNMSNCVQDPSSVSGVKCVGIPFFKSGRGDMVSNVHDNLPINKGGDGGVEPPVLPPSMLVPHTCRAGDGGPVGRESVLNGSSATGVEQLATSGRAQSLDARGITTDVLGRSCTIPGRAMGGGRRQLSLLHLFEAPERQGIRTGEGGEGNPIGGKGKGRAPHSPSSKSRRGVDYWDDRLSRY
ncbi:unnamed protein product [Discosporangium mesarthrocarpum]